MMFDNWLSKIAFDAIIFETFSPSFSSILQIKNGKL